MSEPDGVPLEQCAALLARAEAAEAEVARLRQALDAALGNHPNNVRPPDGELIQIIVNARRMSMKWYEAEMSEAHKRLFVPTLYVRGWRPLTAAGWYAVEQQFQVSLPTDVYAAGSGNRNGVDHV